VTSESESRQLDVARRMLATQLSTPLRIGDIARAIGMSDSKLKRTFKARFGVTVFDYGLECRMRHALELLRCKRMSVGQVATRGLSAPDQLCVRVPRLFRISAEQGTNRDALVSGV